MATGFGSSISILLPDLRGGGVERVRLVLAEQFSRLGHEVEFVLVRTEGELLAEAQASFVVHGLGCSRMRQVPLRLSNYLRERRPDALLAAMWPLTGIAGVAKRFSYPSLRLVVSEHNDFRMMPSLKKQERWALKRFGHRFYAPCDRIVAVSSGVAESLSEEAGLLLEDVTVIHNPVRALPKEEMSVGDRSLIAGWFEGEVRLVAIGTLKQQKGFDVLVRALALLRERIDARLLVLGEGGLRDELESLAVCLGVADSVWLPGFRVNPGTFLEQADVFVLSSNWEGFGNVIVEALASGIPVVATDCLSGPSEILDRGKYGQLVPVGDAAALAHAIENTILNPPDIASLKARAQDFTPERAAKAYLELLVGA